MAVHSECAKTMADLCGLTSMDDGQAHITEDVLGVAAPQQLSHTLPAVLDCVQLLEVVLASICWQLQLRAFNKASKIAFKIL